MSDSKHFEKGNQWYSKSFRAWVALLVILTTYHLIFLLWRISLPLEMDRNEAWNAWHALNAFDPSQLYPKPTDLIVNNYPPLSFVLLRLFSFGGEPILIGRIISLLSIGLIAYCVADVARSLGRNLGAASIAGAWIFGIFIIIVPIYPGMNDPNFAALAIMMTGLALFIRSCVQGETPYLASTIMVTALFFKHSIIALPIAAFVWLLMTERRLFWRSAGYFLLLGGVGLVACSIFYGEDFFAQLLFPRTMKLTSGFRFFRVVPALVPAFVVWWQWLKTSPDRRPVLFTKIAFATTVPLNFLQQSGAGVDYNATFEFIIVSAIALGCSLYPPDRRHSGSEKPKSGRSYALPAMVIFMLIFGNRLEPYRFVGAKYRDGVSQQVAVLKSEVSRIAALPGNVACDAFIVCYYAGKKFVYDDFAMDQRVATGRWNSELLKTEIASHAIRFEKVSPLTKWQSTNFASLLY